MQGVFYIVFATFLAYIGLLIETVTRARAFKLRINPVLLLGLPLVLVGVNIKLMLSSELDNKDRKYFVKHFLFNYRKTLTVFLATVIAVISLKSHEVKRPDRTIGVNARSLFAASREYGSSAVTA